LTTIPTPPGPPLLPYTTLFRSERSLRESCASTLGVEGYHVTTSGRAQEAFEILKRRAFDIVLIDLYMADVPGIELLRTALATHRSEEHTSELQSRFDLVCRLLL